jgi:hypothetical protein
MATVDIVKSVATTEYSAGRTRGIEAAGDAHCSR